MRRSTISLEQTSKSEILNWGRPVWGVAMALFAALIFGTAEGLAQQEATDEKSEAAETEAPAEGDGAAAPEEPAAEGEMKAEGEKAATEGDRAPAEEPVPNPVEPMPEEPAAEAAGPELPEGYKPPGVRPPTMTIVKELITAEDAAALMKELKSANFNNILRAGQLDSDATELMKKVAKLYVYRMSMRKPLQDREIHKMRDELMTQVAIAASIAPAVQQADAFRTTFLQEIVDRLTELLDGNEIVRLNAVYALSNLNLREYNLQKQPVPVPFSPAFKPLLAVIKSTDQPISVKVAALKGIHRISTTGTLSQTERLDAAEQIVNDLKNPKLHFWYQLRLVETLSRLDLTVDRDNRPFVVQILTEIVADRGRMWIVRSFAAKGLGRAKIPATVNLNKVVYEIVQLARDMVVAYNKQPQEAYWKMCFYNIYIAFHPLDPIEREGVDPADAAKFGLLQNVGQYKPLIQSSYEQIVPLAKFMLNGNNIGNPFPDERTAQLDNWLKQNIPGNQSVAPNMPAINNIQARDASKQSQ